jgi:hypothetical protein
MSAINASLTEATIACIRERFAGWHHEPSREQWAALTDLAAYLQAMADGTARQAFALCDLDPGMGKSQTAASFLRCLLDDHRYTNTGALVMVSRLAEIDSFVRAIGLRDDEFAALASKSNAEGRQRLEMGLTAENADRARVLFITQQRLALVSEHGRQFAVMRQFYFQGKPRQVRIWDESLMPALGLRLDHYQIAGLANGFKANGFRDVADWCLNLANALKTAQDNTIMDLEMPRKAEIELADMRRIFVGKNVEAAEDLWLLADQEQGLVRYENKGNALISFTEALPADLAPCVILDASGRVRSTYDQWATYRRTLSRLRGARKDYSNLTVWRCNRPTSQSAWARWTQEADTHRRKVTVDELVELVAEIIGTRPEHEPFLIVTHKPKPKLLDAEALIRRAIGGRQGPLYFLHYGEHTATNDYVGVENVIIAGTLIYEPARYEADGRGASGTSIDQDYDEDLRRQVRLGEHAHHFFQAICRCAVRRSVETSCGTARCWIIGANKDGFHQESLEGTFPGAKIMPFGRETFVRRMLPQGKVKHALDAILARLHDAGEVLATDIGAAVGYETTTFRKFIRRHPSFLAACAVAGIEEAISGHLKGANGKPALVFRRSL